MEVIIKPNRDQIILSDPTLIFRKGVYHLYVWSYLGIQEYQSSDLKKWKISSNVLSVTLNYENEIIDLSYEGLGFISIIRNLFKYNRSHKGHLNAHIRPFIFEDNGIYYLLFQKTKFYWKDGKIELPSSEIQFIISEDLVSWSAPQTLLKSTQKFPNVSAPCLQKIGNKYRLLFTYDMEYTKNTTFAEPKYFAFADLNNLNSEPKRITKVRVIDENNENVKQVGYVRFRNGIYTCNPIKTLGHYSNSRAYYAKLNSSKGILKVTYPILSKSEEERFSDSYTSDLVENKLFFNARLRSSILDFHDNSQKSKLANALLVLKSIFLNKEVICLKDIGQFN